MVNVPRDVLWSEENSLTVILSPSCPARHAQQAPQSTGFRLIRGTCSGGVDPTDKTHGVDIEMPKPARPRGRDKAMLIRRPVLRGRFPLTILTLAASAGLAWGQGVVLPAAGPVNRSMAGAAVAAP